ncbi:MAG: glycosyltransferase [Lewinellaceae bacterium]|nr:glycosyltransferase [Lewinellaceae bacterium]
MTLYSWTIWIFGFAWLLQMALWWGVFAPFAWKKRKEPVTKASHLPCSVVVCARNEANNLQQNLPKLLGQEYPTYEVLVVDDASSDQTLSALKKLCAIHSNLRVLSIPVKKTAGKKAAILQGVQAARYPHIVVTDSDCRPNSKMWLQIMMAGFSEKASTEIVLGYAPHDAAPGWLNAWQRFETYFTAFQYGALAHAGQPYMGVGRNMAFLQRKYSTAPQPQLASGDDDLFVNANASAGNCALCFHPDAWMYSRAEASWSHWLRQKRRQLSAGPHYRLRHQIMLAGIAVSHVLFYGAFAALLLMGGTPDWVWVAFLLRGWSVALLISKSGKQMGIRDLSPLAPVFDLLLCLYWGVLTPALLLFGPGKRWK